MSSKTKRFTDIIDISDNSAAPAKKKKCLGEESAKRRKKSISIDLTEPNELCGDPTANVPLLIDLSLTDQKIDNATGPEASLPHFLWMKLFRHLNDEDRRSVAKTCTYWNNIIKKHVGFHRYLIFRSQGVKSLFKTAEITQTTTIDSFSITPLERSDFEGSDIPFLFGKPSLGAQAIRKRILHDNNQLIHLMNDQKIVASVPINQECKNYSLLPIELTQEYTTWFQSSEPKDSNLTLQGTIYPDKEDFYKNSLMDFSPLETVAIHLLIRERAIAEFKNLLWKSILPSRFSPTTQPIGFKGDLVMYEYQLQALAWMKDLESLGSKKKYNFSTRVKTPGFLDLYVNVAPLDPSHCIYDRDDGSQNIKFSLRGGILADEMGLGKTVTMISLILANPSSMPTYVQDVTEHFLIPTKATLIVCASQLVAQWAEEIETKTNLTVLRLSTLTNMKKATNQDILDHDVVIAPFSLLTKNRQYQSCYEERHYPSIIRLDACLPNFMKFKWHRIIADEAHEIDQKALEIWDEYHAEYRWYVTGTPFPKQRESFLRALRFLEMELEYKNRFYSLDSFLSNMKSMNSNLAPFEMELWKVIQRIAFWRQTKEDVIVQTDIPSLTENIQYLELSPIEKALYEAASYEKNSAKLQREICSDPRSSSIISPSLKNISLCKLPIFMANQYTDLINKCIDSLRWERIERAKAQNRLKKENRILHPMPHDSARFSSQKKIISAIEREITRRTSEIRKCLENIVKNGELYQIFTLLLPLKGTEESCAICKEIMHSPIILFCDHQFCRCCLVKSITDSNSINCPTCNSKQALERLTFPVFKTEKKGMPETEDIFGIGMFPQGIFPQGIFRAMGEGFEKTEKIEGNEEIEEIEEIEEGLPGTVQYVFDSRGSKMGSVVEYLIDVVRDSDVIRKVIVFSQYHSHLSSLQKILHSIDYQLFSKQIVVCKGNIHVRTKKLKSFNSTEKNSPRILMLSLLNSASGSQLEAASHIILLDPVVGTREEAQAIDAQAIARAHRLGQDKPVQAVRFIASMTIEQSDYENAYGKRSRAKSARSVINEC